MGFKMNGPTFYKNTPLKQAEKETLNVKKGSEADKKSKRMMKKEMRPLKKTKKTLEDYLNEGFSQVEAEQMYLNQATTGRANT